MQRLQYEGRAVGKKPDQLVVAHLVSDSRSNAAGCDEGLVREGRPILGDPQEWRPQTALRHKLVDRVRIEQSCKSAFVEIGGW